MIGTVLVQQLWYKERHRWAMLWLCRRLIGVLDLMAGVCMTDTKDYADEIVFLHRAML